MTKVGRRDIKIGVGVSKSFVENIIYYSIYHIKLLHVKVLILMV